MRAGGTELISHMLEGNCVPVVGAPRSAPACLGFARHLYSSTGESSCPFSLESSVLFQAGGWGSSHARNSSWRGEIEALPLSFHERSHLEAGCGYCSLSW